MMKRGGVKEWRNKHENKEMKFKQCKKWYLHHDKWMRIIAQKRTFFFCLYDWVFIFVLLLHPALFFSLSFFYFPCMVYFSFFSFSRVAMVCTMFWKFVLFVHTFLAFIWANLRFPKKREHFSLWTAIDI